MTSGGYLPAERAAAVDAETALRLMRMAIRWYAVPGWRRMSPEGGRPPRDGAERDRSEAESREDVRDQVNQFTLPPDAVLLRRMHGIVAVVLGQLRAGGDWGAIAAEYLHGGAAATALGEDEAAFFASR